jgi:hypothetical protein
VKRWRGTTLALASVAVLFAVPGLATAHDKWMVEDGDGPDQETTMSANFSLLAQFPAPPDATGNRPTSSDIAFWGDRAYVGDYNGFRIFDISKKIPRLVADVRCPGPQGDPSAWDRNGDGRADLVLLSVDRTMAGPECGAPVTAHDDPAGWEGIRIFDVSNESKVKQIAAVYQDCGSHTHTVIPRKDKLVVLNSSYPLRPGPTCGPVRGPEAGRDALHGVVQVVEVPLANPAKAKETTELPIVYPGDADNNYLPLKEHNLAGGQFGGIPGLVDGMRACHDISVFPAVGLVGAACAEQAQMWKINDKTGLPDTANPLWVHDQPNVDFWHSATFSWDGKIVNFIDESFGDDCPTVTNKTAGLPGAPKDYQTGNMFFMDARTGELLSEFRIGRTNRTGTGAYCSSHLGNVVPSQDRYLLVNAYYRGGSSIIDFTDPTRPQEIAYHDRKDADTWSAYWYERRGAPQGNTMSIWSNDGVHTPNTGGGFQAFNAKPGPTKRVGVDHLNPQTQDFVVEMTTKRGRAPKSQRPSYAQGRKASKQKKAGSARAAEK